MAKTNFQDPGTSEILSTPIAGIMEAINKLEESVGIGTQAETGIALSEVIAYDGDNEVHYRIYQCANGKRNWIADPVPVIKKNGSIISSGFMLDYFGGSIILTTAATSSDVFTADATHTVIK